MRDFISDADAQDEQAIGGINTEGARRDKMSPRSINKIIIEIQNGENEKKTHASCFTMICHAPAENLR